MTAVEIVSRLTHHHAESRKCIADYYRFGCECGQHPLIEHQQFTGAAPVRCACGSTVRINFEAAILSAGKPPELDPDPWGNILTK